MSTSVYITCRLTSAGENVSNRAKFSVALANNALENQTLKGTKVKRAIMGKLQHTKRWGVKLKDSVFVSDRIYTIFLTINNNFFQALKGTKSKRAITGKLKHA